MDIDFDCTLCGKCCRDLKLPLTVQEAIAWLEDGHEVQILCEAVPWPQEPAEDDGPAQHKRRRSFPAVSGDLPIRVVVILAAPFDGPCPNLQPDFRCGIYTRRPLVCRIYPAEINPFVRLHPAYKNCPPEAWAPGRPPLLRQGVMVDAQLQGLIEQSRRTDVEDVPTKERLCTALDLTTAALANEGLVVHSPEREALLDGLRQAQREGDRHAIPRHWRLVSNQRATREAQAAAGACWEAEDTAGRRFAYLGFHPATT